ncbi:MAG TPA: tetratricopeptide repeat protein [Burkholderiaceae bacterium]|jgi:predicted negative regulator of RcsB-dependent stress response|nr:tetratricopeptide repeat protein [Burkholderiaceae bacterium]
MSYDLQEQEQLDALKAWWRANNSRLTWAATAILVAVLAYQGWTWYTLRQSAAASVLYEEFERAAASKDPKDATKARDLAGTLIDQHGSTVYAAMAALREAKSNIDAGDPKTAKAQLSWAAEHAAQKELGLLARVRLAGVLLDEKAYDPALQVLKVDVPDAFACQFADRRGDVYAAQGKFADARAAYSEALAKAGNQPLRAMIQMKLDALPAAGA